MARVTISEHANSYMIEHGIAVHDVIEVISDYEVIQEDFRQSGFAQAGKTVGDRMLWVTYTALGDSLVVVTVSD